VKPAARRGALLWSVGLLVVVLVGGRWLALETAERAWAASIPGGSAYLTARDFARLVSGLLLVAGVAWATANLLVVYRSIGSMQLSRRLGDLEIVEAVPQPLLLAGTIAIGLVFGFLLTLGTGDWWMHAALASAAPTFGVTDPVLHRDVGYYLAQLPWALRLQQFALLAVSTATTVVVLLYAGIGSLRFRRWLPYANAHARAHLGLLLALLALTLTWDALLDPPATVAGLNGMITQRALDLRLPAAPVVAGFGLGAAGVSLVWGLRERPVLLVTAWGAWLVAWVLGFAVIPGPLPPAGSEAARVGLSDSALVAGQRRLEGLAFGVSAPVESAPPAYSTPEVAVAALPVWDEPRVIAAAARRDGTGGREVPVAAALTPRPPRAGRPAWVVAFRPAPDSTSSGPTRDWAALHRYPGARAGRPIAAIEDDTALDFSPLPTRDSVSWFGPGFTEFGVAPADTWPALRRSGIALVGWWRRTALAWALQSPALARAETDGVLLLWRRDVAARIARLAPFATFDDPVPVVADSGLWWVAYGYVASEAFPLVRPVVGGGRATRYLRSALVATVQAASGDTRFYLAPGADSLAAAWARLLAPLIRPLASLPAAVRTQLPFPRRAFEAATTLVRRWQADTSRWTPRPREPFELVAPRALGGAVGEGAWMAQGFDAGSTLVAVFAGTVVPEARLYLWRPAPTVRLPGELLGSPNTSAPGVLRLWNAAGTLVSKQALFLQPAAGGPPSGIDTVFLTWGDRRGQGSGASSALRDLLGAAGAPRLPEDTTLAGRWRRAQRLAAQAEAALAAGDLEAFGRLYRQLQSVLGVGRGKLAPPAERR
jgi:uncharacterized protein UPF0182